MEPPAVCGSEAQYFVGIGAQKAGTSWLAEYLMQHPEVYLFPLKEMHFFDSLHKRAFSAWEETFEKKLKKRLTERLRNYPPNKVDETFLALLWRVAMSGDRDAYRAYFSGMLCEHHKAFGEITPSYSVIGEAGFRDIIAIFPRAKFIFIMRNPADRFWSALRYHYRNKPDVDVQLELPQFLTNAWALARTNYADTLRSLSNACAQDRVITLFYENMFSPAGPGELRRLTDFLEISFLEPAFDRKVNEGREAAQMPPDTRVTLVKTFADTYRYVAARFTADLPESWRADMLLLDQA